MTKNNNNIANFSSSLHKPWVWICVYVFFTALPILIFLECYRTHLEHKKSKARSKVVKYYNRELTSFRSKSTNKQIFIQHLQLFRDNFRRNLPKLEKNRTLHADLVKSFPKDATLIFWDSNRNFINQFNSSTNQDKLFAIQKQKDFIDLMLNSVLDYTNGTILQTEKQHEEFMQQHSAFFDSLAPVFGPYFPFSQAFLSPNKIISTHTDKTPVFFYWDFFNQKDNNQGGFAVIIPKSQLTSTFGLDQVLAKDPTANPDFSNGYFNQENKNLKLSFPSLGQIAEKLIAEYKKIRISPLEKGNWIISVTPMPDSPSVAIFSIYSIRNLAKIYKRQYTNAIYAAGFILLVLAFMFSYYYKKSKQTGLSLKKKLASLFFLCMLLPISILIFLGMQYSYSKETLLSKEADNSLLGILKRVDFSAKEHYNSETLWLRNLKQLEAIKNLNLEQMHKAFFELTKEEKLQAVYLVDSEGKIIFDNENNSAAPQSRLFIKELGKRILYSANLSNSSIGTNKSEALNIPTFSNSFINEVSKQTKVLHQITWPGTKDLAFLYTDRIKTNNKTSLALIVRINKRSIDRNYLKQAIVSQSKVDNNYEIFVLNKNDISDSFPKLSSTFKANLLPMLSTVKIGNIPETDRLADGKTRFLVGLGKGQYINDYLIGARIDLHKIMQSILLLNRLIGAGLLFSLLASLFLVTVLIREFLTPVSILSKGARSIISGDLEHSLPVFAKDELGDLSTTFNFMTKRLRNRLTELTVLYNLTQRASTSHNPREVFELAAENLLKHLEAEKGGTAWKNEGEGDDSLYLTDHFSDEMAEAISHICKNALKAFSIQNDFFKPLEKYILSIPLFFEEKTFGAIYLIFPKDRFKTELSFSEDEKSFIETLRHHLSLIIEKQRLFEQAITDGLTKLYVRRFFLANLEKELSRSRRYQIPVSILLLDIDHFKKFNDNYGHQAGDHVLKETAQRIMESIRSVDTPGRYGGEEMSVILPQTSIKEAYIVAERIRSSIENSEYNYRGSTMKVTVSIGLSALSLRDISMEEIIEEADKALYIAKEKGRNQVRIAPEAM